MNPFVGVTVNGKAEFIHLGYVVWFNRHSNVVSIISGKQFQLVEAEMRRFMEAMDKWYAESKSKG